MFSFKEMLPYHISHTIMVVMEWDHLHKCRSSYRADYVKHLKPGMTLPHRATSIKIMEVIKALQSIKLKGYLASQVCELGNPIVGAQADIFSLKNCSEARTQLRSGHN